MGRHQGAWPPPAYPHFSEPSICVPLYVLIKNSPFLFVKFRHPPVSLFCAYVVHKFILSKIQRALPLLRLARLDHISDLRTVLLVLQHICMGGGGCVQSLCLTIFIYLTREMKALSFSPHPQPQDSLYFHHVHALFISPIFLTKIYLFLLKKTAPPPGPCKYTDTTSLRIYSNGSDYIFRF